MIYHQAWVSAADNGVNCKMNKTNDAVHSQMHVLIHAVAKMCSESHTVRPSSLNFMFENLNVVE